MPNIPKTLLLTSNNIISSSIFGFFSCNFSSFTFLAIFILARIKTYESREAKAKMMQARIHSARAVSPFASPGVMASTEVKMFTRTSRVVINRAHLKILIH